MICETAICSKFTILCRTHAQILSNSAQILAINAINLQNLQSPQFKQLVKVLFQFYIPTHGPRCPWERGVLRASPCFLGSLAGACQADLVKLVLAVAGDGRSALLEAAAAEAHPRLF